MRILYFSLLALFTLQTTEAQIEWTAKDSASVYRLENYVRTAEEKLKKADNNVHYADSLILLGTYQISKGKEKEKSLKEEKKYMEKQYASNIKAMEKDILSSNKQKADKAKAMLKETTAIYKTDIRELNNKITSTNKLINTGHRNLEKGKTYIKVYKKNRKEAEAALNNAKEKLDNILQSLNHKTKEVAINIP